MTKFNFRKISVLFLFSLVCFFGLYKLTESPSLVYDEGWYFQTSANLAREGIDGIRMSPVGITHISTFVTVGYPLIYPLALWFKIFSVGVFQARFFMFLILFGFVTVSYFLVKKMYGKGIALSTLALIATFPPLYGNGKTVMGEMPGLLFLVSFLFFLTCIKSHPKRKLLFIILAGIFAGLCVAVKPLFILLLPALCIGALIEWKRKALSIREVIIAVVSTLVPIIIWFLIQFRFGDSLKETLNYYANPYSLGNISEIIVANIKRLFSDASTLYTVFLIVVWGSALCLRWRSKIKIHTEEIIGLVYSVLVVLAYLRTAGQYRYFFTAQVVSLIFFPYAAFYISDAIGKKITFWKTNILFPTLIVLLGILGVYQLGFDSWVAQAYASHKTAYWQEYFSKAPESTSFFFYNTPEVVPFIQSKNYYQYLILYDRSLGTENLNVVTSGKVDKIIVQTVLFNDRKQGDFKLYKETEKAYKYSILEKR